MESKNGSYINNIPREYTLQVLQEDSLLKKLDSLEIAR